MPLHDFQITSLSELDYAFYLVNFDRIEIAWLTGTAWRVHYRVPCRSLDPQRNQCTVHGTPDQPNVCKRYNAYTCSYKRIFQGPETTDATYLRFDRRRLLVFADMLMFDGNRDLVHVPERAAVVGQLPPMAPDSDPPVPPDPMLAAWERAVRTGAGLPTVQVRTFQDFDAPCAGCDAHCCTSLSFPHSTPATVASLDHIRFCLGFPGIEVGIDAQDRWTILVRTRCRNLQPDARCAVFGTRERPQTCAMYDASMCTFRYQRGQPRPERFLRLQHAGFPVIRDLFQFDEHGDVLRRPGYQQVRQAIERRWAHEGRRQRVP